MTTDTKTREDFVLMIKGIDPGAVREALGDQFPSPTPLPQPTSEMREAGLTVPIFFACKNTEGTTSFFITTDLEPTELLDALAGIHDTLCAAIQNGVLILGLADHNQTPH